MTRVEIAQHVTQALASVAPELESMTLQPDLPLRDQLDIDSMDFLRFVMELHKQLGVDVPEADYGRLGSLTQIVDYLTPKIAAQR
jgi:acyl carrier protein